MAWRQVLLDGIVRKVDRRRRVLLWRTAAMAGVTANNKVCVCGVAVVVVVSTT